ncbi:MAG TPA: hypothetical protein VN843_29900, partial [Anaerolineales bacterium]|nr:hypothetical protein [Anaerolineales bacterium]
MYYQTGIEFGYWIEIFSSMRILQVHNYYTAPGGEDTVFHAETALLRSRGHEVLQYLEINKRIESMH